MVKLAFDHLVNPETHVHIGIYSEITSLKSWTSEPGSILYVSWIIKLEMLYTTGSYKHSKFIFISWISLSYDHWAELFLTFAISGTFLIIMVSLFQVKAIFFSFIHTFHCTLLESLWCYVNGWYSQNAEEEVFHL